MIQLTPEQRRELNGPDPLVLDPETGETYVLVRKTLFERMKSLFTDDTAYTTAETLDRVMAEDDAHDPQLAELRKRYGGQ